MSNSQNMEFTTFANLVPGPGGIHRASCHHCGNIRKSYVKCVNCPHVSCSRCAAKSIIEWGKNVFDTGCPVCSLRCCCADPRDCQYCPRLYHCYKKCPATKNAGQPGGGDTMSQMTDKKPLCDPDTAAMIANELVSSSMNTPPRGDDYTPRVPSISQEELIKHHQELQALRDSWHLHAVPEPHPATKRLRSSSIASHHDHDISPPRTRTRGHSSVYGSYASPSSPSPSRSSTRRSTTSTHVPSHVSHVTSPSSTRRRHSPYATHSPLVDERTRGSTEKLPPRHGHAAPTFPSLKSSPPFSTRSPNAVDSSVGFSVQSNTQDRAAAGKEAAMIKIEDFDAEVTAPITTRERTTTESDSRTAPSYTTPLVEEIQSEISLFDMTEPSSFGDKSKAKGSTLAHTYLSPIQGLSNISGPKAPSIVNDNIRVFTPSTTPTPTPTPTVDYIAQFESSLNVTELVDQPISQPPPPPFHGLESTSRPEISTKKTHDVNSMLQDTLPSLPSPDTFHTQAQGSKFGMDDAGLGLGLDIYDTPDNDTNQYSEGNMSKTMGKPKEHEYLQVPGLSDYHTFPSNNQADSTSMDDFGIY